MSKKNALKTVVVLLAMMSVAFAPVMALARAAEKGDTLEARAAGGYWLEYEYDWYYFDYALGDYVEGAWAKIGGDWYYFHEDGTMANGILTLDGKEYYLGGSGDLHTGWLQIGSNEDDWFYAGADGALQKSKWIKSGNNWYFVRKDKTMAYSMWLQIDGVWYFFRKTGVMATGKVNIDGTDRYFNNNGAWIS